MTGAEALTRAVANQGKRFVDVNGNFVYVQGNILIVQNRNGQKYRVGDAFSDQFAPFREEMDDEMDGEGDETD